MALADELQQSIAGMQENMQATYKKLAETQITGTSEDGTVSVTITATYDFVDIDLNEKSLFGGLDKLKQRISQAWQDVSVRIREATQSQTAELLSSMELPEEIRKLQEENKPQLLEAEQAEKA